MFQFIYLLLVSLSGSNAFLQRRDTNSSISSASLESIWDYSGDEKIYGISLGGWFVLEPYITPSLFSQFGTNESTIPVDEYTFTETLGKEEAERQLTTHWSTYFTESDFKDIKNYGFNLVRIPIGYWTWFTLDDDPYVQGQEQYIDQAIDWAQQNDLKVWIDLHGVPGSQNGFDNSGKRGKVGWQDDDENISISYETLNYIYGKYGGSNYTETIIGIEIVNEPLSGKLNETELLEFYYQSYYDFRDDHESPNYFVIQEAFFPIGYWNKHFNNDYKNVSRPYTKSFNESVTKDYFKGVIVDHHHYEVFTESQLNNTSEERVNDIRNYAESIGKEQKYHPSLVGEWSGAITDCAKWLNGVGVGARYDGTYDASQLIRPGDEDEDEDEDDDDDSGKDVILDKRLFKRDDTSSSSRNCSNLLDYDDFSKDHKESIRKFIEIQLVEYNKTNAGWIFWNYKTEDAIEWDFKKLAEKDLFPQPFNDYKYFYSNGSAIEDEKESGSPRLYPTTSLITFAFCLFVFGFI